MSRYIKEFSTSGDVQTAVDNGTLSKPYVAYINSTSGVDFNTIVDYKTIPLTIKVTSPGTIRMHGRANTTYSLNGGSFTYLPNASYTTINVVQGDKIIFKNTDATYGATFKESTAGFIVYGNICYYNGGTAGSYQEMFKSCTGLTDASNLILPASTVAQGCYDMFNGCTNLTTAPVLPATTLANKCYYQMFAGCRNLNYIKCLATDISATDCTNFWVYNVQTTSGTFVTPSSTNWSTGVSGIPTNWTRVNA